VPLLAGRIDGAVVLDTDLFGDHAHPDWSAWAGGWVEVARGIRANGLTPVLVGYGLGRELFEPGEVIVLHLAVADDVIRQRLRRRSDYDDERIERKLRNADALGREADAVLDVSGLSPERVAAEVEAWIRSTVSRPPVR
jgi:hypothetical protein